ncbi:MAG TPA: Ig-like domain-containing protein [Longimicrobium sp.]|nr:Ig-like domain-containing protein [Longimicrobium sp.]
MQWSGAIRAALVIGLGALAGCADSTGPRTGPAAKLDVVAGNTQSAAAGAELPQPLVVKVSDAKGRAVKGQVVNFVVTAGGGQVFAGTALTNDDGLAQERWTLGKVAGAPQTLEARAVDSSTGQALVFATFTATATAGAAATVGALNGDSLVSGVSGSAVEDSFAVVVRDPYGNAVPGAQVAWAVTSGGGTIVSPSTTDAQGIARTQWVLGTAAGAIQTAQATAAGGSAHFIATVGTALARTAGDGQTTGAGTTLTVTVRATGAGGGVGDLPIRWQVGSGGGSVTPAAGRTLASGDASAQWTLGSAPGTQTLTASAGALSVTFTATAIGNGTRVTVAQVPGRVLDASATQVVWLDSAGGARRVKLRDVSAGGDVVIKTDTTGKPGITAARLVTGGVLLWTYETSEAWVFEWRGGTLSLLGGYSSAGAPAVDGDWAMWATNSGTQFARRNLATGAADLIARTTGGPFDIGPNGLAAFTDGFLIKRDLAGSQSTLIPGGSGVLVHLVTDGVNVAYTQVSGAGAASGWVAAGGGQEMLFSTAAGPYAVMTEGGWTAWFANHGVGRRSPAGARTEVVPAGYASALSALSPTGSVVYLFPAADGYRYRLVTATGAQTDLGPVAFIPGSTENERVVWRGDRFLAILGGTVSELRP